MTATQTTKQPKTPAHLRKTRRRRNKRTRRQRESSWTASASTFPLNNSENRQTDRGGSRKSACRTGCLCSASFARRAQLVCGPSTRSCTSLTASQSRVTGLWPSWRTARARNKLRFWPRRNIWHSSSRARCTIAKTRARRSASLVRLSRFHSRPVKRLRTNANTNQNTNNETNIMNTNCAGGGAAGARSVGAPTRAARATFLPLSGPGEPDPCVGSGCSKSGLFGATKSLRSKTCPIETGCSLPPGLRICSPRSFRSIGGAVFRPFFGRCFRSERSGMFSLRKRAFSGLRATV